MYVKKTVILFLQFLCINWEVVTFWIYKFLMKLIVCGDGSDVSSFQWENSLKISEYSELIYRSIRTQD